jgi:hypothetical protein
MTSIQKPVINTVDRITDGSAAIKREYRMRCPRKKQKLKIPWPGDSGDRFVNRTPVIDMKK